MSIGTVEEESMQISDIDDVRPSRLTMDQRKTAELASSMALEGLRHPVLVMPGGHLLKGGRRVAAARMLGWTTIAAKQVSTVEEAVAALVDCRDEFSEARTIEEMVALGITIEAMDHGDSHAADYTQLIGGVVSSSGSLYKRARSVVQAAHSKLRPQHVVETARAALAAYEAGTMTISGASDRVRAAEKATGTGGRINGKVAVIADVVAPDGLPTTPPPNAAARSPRARKLREEWIRALISQGATSEQISGRIGIGVNAIKKICKDNGLVVAADAALAKTQRRAADPNKAMRVVIDDLDALVWSLDRLDVAALDPTEVAQWAVLLSGYARRISKVSRTIKGVQ